MAAKQYLTHAEVHGTLKRGGSGANRAPKCLQRVNATTMNQRDLIICLVAAFIFFLFACGVIWARNIRSRRRNAYEQQRINSRQQKPNQQV